MSEAIGYATLPIIPSLRGARAAMERELNGVGSGAGAAAGTRFGNSFGDSAKRSMSSKLAGLASTLSKGFSIATVAALGAGAAVAAIGVKGAASLETTTTSFTALLGSTQKATQQIKLLQQYAAKTPFSQQDVLGYAQQYYALAGSVGLSKDKVTDFLDAVGNLGAVTGASTENIHNAVMAIGQIGSSGRVTLDNLNQISEAFPGFNGAAAIASATGQTTAQVMQQISKGSLDAKTGVNALLIGMTKFTGAAGAMNKQSATLAGLWSTFTDTFQMAATKAFQPVIPLIKKTLDQITPVISSTLQTVAPAIAQFMQGLMPLLAPLVSGLGQAIGAVFAALGPALQALAPLVAPLAAAFVGLAQALAPILLLAAKLITTLGVPLLNLLRTLFAAIKPVADALLTALAPVMPIIAKSLGDVVVALKPLIVALGQGLAQVVADIAPELPELAQAFGDLAVASAELMASAAPLIGLLAKLIGWLVKFDIPQLHAVAAAIEAIAGAIHNMSVVLDGAPEMVKSAWGEVTGIVSGGSGQIVGDLSSVASAFDNVGLHAQAAAANASAYVGNLGQLAAQGKAVAKGKHLFTVTKPEVPAFTIPKLPSFTPSSGGSGGGGGLSAASLGKSVADKVRAAFQKVNIDVKTLGIDNARKQIGKAQDALAKGISQGLSSKMTKEFRRELGVFRDKAKSQLRNLKNTIAGHDFWAFESGTNGSASDERAGFNALAKNARLAGLSDKAVAALRKQNNALAVEVSKRNSVATRLAAAQQKLSDALDKYNGEKSQVAGAFTGAFNAGTAGTGFDGQQTVTAGSILAQLKQTVARAGRFYDLLRSLKTKGMPAGLLDQLAQAGPDALPQAEALAAASKTDLASIKSNYSSLSSTASKIGTFMADDLYGAGVNAARGLVAGLQSQESTLNKAIERMADNIVNTIKKKLKIHSPSRVTRELGGYTGQGFGLGLTDSISDVEQASKSLANASRPKLAPRAAVGAGAADAQSAIVESVVAAVMAELPARFGFDFNGREVARMNEKSAQAYARGR